MYPGATSHKGLWPLEGPPPSPMMRSTGSSRNGSVQFTGHDLPLHDARRIIATSIAIYDPANVAVASQASAMLNELRVTQAHYSGDRHRSQPGGGSINDSVMRKKTSKAVGPKNTSICLNFRVAILVELRGHSEGFVSSRHVRSLAIKRTSNTAPTPGRHPREKGCPQAPQQHGVTVTSRSSK